MAETLCVRTSRRWKLIWFWVSGWLPMLRRTNRMRMAALSEITVRKMKSERDRADREIADAKKVLDSIASKAASTTWRASRDGSYAMTMLLNPECFGGLRYGQEELRYLAKHFGYMVEREIATCKFIEKAHSQDYRRPIRSMDGDYIQPSFE